MSDKYEPTSSGYREVDAEDKDKAAITEAVTPEKKLSGTKEDSPADKKTKKAKGGRKAKGAKTDKGDGRPGTSAAVDNKKRKYPKNVGAEGGASGRRLALETNMEVPYPQLGGHSVSQLFGMETYKRKSILGEKDEEFVKNYMS